MELRLNQAIQDNANVKVGEDASVGLVLSHFHLRQELHKVFHSESFEERSVVELLSGFPRKLHHPLLFGVKSAKQRPLYGAADVLVRL